MEEWKVAQGLISVQSNLPSTFQGFHISKCPRHVMRRDEPFAPLSKVSAERDITSRYRRLREEGDRFRRDSGSRGLDVGSVSPLGRYLLQNQCMHPSRPDNWRVFVFLIASISVLVNWEMFRMAYHRDIQYLTYDAADLFVLGFESENGTSPPATE